MVTDNVSLRIMSQRDAQEPLVTFSSFTVDGNVCTADSNRKSASEGHFHPEKIEFILFTEGNAVYKIADVEYPIQAGDVFFIGDRQKHTIMKITEPLRVINICFEPRFIWSSNVGFEESHYLQLLFSLGKGIPPRFEADWEVTAGFRRILLQIQQECTEQKSDHVSFLRSLLIMLLIELSRYTDGHNQDKIGSFSEVDYRLISKSMDYINENLEKQMTLAEIAEKANLSSNYYCNLFKRLNGVTLWEYITSKRIDMVMKRLPNYNGKIIDLALSCGFNNTANFNRAFKKCTGMTPSAYRKNMQAVNNQEYGG